MRARARLRRVDPAATRSTVSMQNMPLRACLAVLFSCIAIRAHALDPQQQLTLDIFKDLIEINTVTATGDTARAAEAMAARLRAAGFAGSDVQVLSPAPRKGNLVARLRGSGAR